MEPVQMTARKVPASIAGLLQELELEQPIVVIRELLASAIESTGSHLDPVQAAERLVREGWLLPLRTRDAWEFVPASRAAAISSGDPWLELRALLMHRPAAPVAVAFASAIWEHGFSMHPPSRQTLAHRPQWRAPDSLDDARTVTYEWRLATAERNGLPLWQPATLVVAIAELPRWQLDWANADTWLPETMRGSARQDIVAEAVGRPVAALVRLGYFAQWSGRSDVADDIAALLPDSLPVTYLGPRQPRGRWIPQWRLYDALLPAR